MRISIRFMAACLLALSLAGCSGPARSDRAAAEETAAGVEVRPATAEQVLRAVRNRGGRATLVNVWATWCEPCREEMPDILRVWRELGDSGMELILVSGDIESQRDQVIEFLAAQGVDFPSFIKSGDDQVFIDGMSDDWSGVLPASFLFDGAGNQVDFWEGIVTYPELKEKVLQILNEA